MWSSCNSAGLYCAARACLEPRFGKDRRGGAFVNVDAVQIGRFTVGMDPAHAPPVEDERVDHVRRVAQAAQRFLEGNRRVPDLIQRNVKRAG